MKFGKLIQRIREELPDAHFLKYKELKKMLKLVKSSESDVVSSLQSSLEAQAQDGGMSSSEGRGTDALSTEETKFIEALNEDLSSLNTYFKHAEEKVVGRLRALGDELSQVEQSSSPADVQRLKSAFIDFHGEIVILLHWGLLNYAAVSKILKKHDKLTGVPLRAPYLDAVFKQPFFSTEALAQLAEKVGAIVEQLVAGTGENEVAFAGRESNPSGGEETSLDQRARITQMALGTWQELKHNASTPSTVLVTQNPQRLLSDTNQRPGEKIAEESEAVSSVRDDIGEGMRSTHLPPIDSESDLRTSYSI